MKKSSIISLTEAVETIKTAILQGQHEALNTQRDARTERLFNFTFI